MRKIISFTIKVNKLRRYEPEAEETTVVIPDDPEAISQMMQLGLVTSKNVDGFITYAIAQNALESQMLLMHYKHEQLGYKKPENAFRL